jgi:serine/threonine protein phosphatase PrpC
MAHARAVDELLTIGEFSDRCGLSPKVLRTYAADGLLMPAAVDRVTGYRYYAPSQLDVAGTIALLRRAGTPLRDIASFLAGPTAARLDEWERDLDAEVAARRQALADVRRSVSGATAPHDPAPEPDGGGSWPNLTAASASAAGRARARNQDALLLDDALFAVADGMGERGEVASLLAVEVLAARFAADRSPAGLAEACRAANRAIWRRAYQDAEVTMGSTVTAVAAVRAGAGGLALAVASIGDSRAYLSRGGVTCRLTQDHSLVAGLVRAGTLTEDEARAHPQRFLLTRALGTGRDVAASLVQVEHQPGDRLLLCTDGLFSELSEDEIGAVLTSAARLGDAADELVRLASGRGGDDDVSVIVIDASTSPDREPAA